MRQIDFVSIRLFVAVAEEKSMSKAAAREHIALAALSKRITKLEDDLELPLLERNPRGVNLTSAGYALLQHARGLLFAMQRLGSELRDYSKGVRGYVWLAANTTAMAYYLPEQLGVFMRDNPSVSVDLQERLSIEVVSAVRDGMADIGIFSSNIPAEKLVVFPYRRDTLVIVTPRKHPLAKYKVIRLQDALAFDFIGLEGASAIHALLAREANALGRPPRLRGQVRSFLAMCRMIQHSIGIGILPELAVMPYLRPMGLRKINLAEKWGQRELLLGVRDVRALTPSANQLLKHLCEKQGNP